MAFSFTKSTPATGSVAIFELKERLKSAGWVVKSSGDGSTFFAATDGITTGASGAGGMANTQAWFRIQDPGGVSEFVFQRGTNNLDWRLKYSKLAQFTGGAPSATQTPSAADEVNRLPGGTDAAPTFTVNVFATDNTYRWNVGADNAAPYGWWAGSFPTGGGNPLTALVYDPMTACEPTDPNKYAFYFSSSSAGALPFDGSGGATTMSTTTFNATNNAIYAYTSAGVSTSIPALTMMLDVSTRVFPTGTVTNPASAKDEVMPIPICRHSSQPLPGWKGVTTLMKWLGTSRTTGDTLTVSTSRDRIVYKHVSLPWDGTVPTV